jgi:predicted acetyltransferase
VRRKVAAVDIRDCVVDDLDAALDVRTRSFGPMPEASRSQWRTMQERAIDEHRLLGAFDGARLVAMARITAFRQWWQGMSLPMAGIGGVVVAPEYRGRGVGTQVMSAILDRSVTLGYPTSALFPATVPPYRGLGYELAGYQNFVTLPAEAVRQIAGRRPVNARRVGPDDSGDICTMIADVHAKHRDCGPIVWPEHEIEAWLRDDEPFAYQAGDGFLAYRWADGNDVLAIDTLIGDSEETIRSLWSLVGSGSSIGRTVRACVPPDDPVRLLTREFAAVTDQQVAWMLRLLDAPAAVAGRGFPAGVEVEVPLSVTDEQLPANSGTWLLRAADGRGTLVPHDRPGLELTARGLAALFAGTRVMTLRRAGLAAAGDQGDDALLDAAFAGTAFMLDYF